MQTVACAPNVSGLVLKHRGCLCSGRNLSPIPEALVWCFCGHKPFFQNQSPVINEEKSLAGDVGGVLSIFCYKIDGGRAGKRPGKHERESREDLTSIHLAGNSFMSPSGWAVTADLLEMRSQRLAWRHRSVISPS